MGEFMVRRLLVFFAASVLFSCASAPLPKEQREYQFVEKTNVSKSDAFQRALGYFAKNLVDSNSAIKVKDENAGRIITRIRQECDEFKAFGDLLGTWTTDFTVEFEAKDMRVRLTLEGLSYDRRDSMGNQATYGYSSEKDVAKGKVCATKLKQEIMQAVNAASKDW